MMQYSRYGMVLERLKEKDIERIRTWRNQPFVKQTMQVRTHISPSDQKAWFHNLHPGKNWYFVVSRQGEHLGLLHIKNIDWTSKTGESGGFVAHQRTLGNGNMGLAILSLMDFAFLVLDLNFLLAYYHPDFSRIATLNCQLGYVEEGRTAEGFIRARVSREAFFGQAARFRKTAALLEGDQVEIIEPDPVVEAKLRDRDIYKRFDFTLG